jgi:hypothetical protein
MPEIACDRCENRRGKPAVIRVILNDDRRAKLLPSAGRKGKIHPTPRRRARLSFAVDVVIVVDVQFRIVPTGRRQRRSLGRIRFAHIKLVGR